MTPGELYGVLGQVPVPRGNWEREAVYVLPGRGVDAAENAAARLRGRPGIAEVRVRPNGFLEIVVERPGEIVREILSREPGRTPREPSPRWPDSPRTWDNPGFVVRYAHARATATLRWARDLGIPMDGFDAGHLDGPHDRAVLRVLAELPSRRTRNTVGWAGYLIKLAHAYHDAHEHAPALPKGDEPVTPTHTARVWLARAVRSVLAQGLTALGETPPDRL